MIVGGLPLVILDPQFQATEGPHLVAVITIRPLLEEDTLGSYSLYPFCYLFTSLKWHPMLQNCSSKWQVCFPTGQKIQ